MHRQAAPRIYVYLCAISGRWTVTLVGLSPCTPLRRRGDGTPHSNNNTIAVLLFHNHRHCCRRSARHIRLKSLPASLDHRQHCTQTSHFTSTHDHTSLFPWQVNQPARSLASLWQHQEISTPTHGTANRHPHIAHGRRSR